MGDFKLKAWYQDIWIVDMIDWKNKRIEMHDPDEIDHTITNTGTAFDDTILLRPTSLKDKNGVEIYEGDIIRKDFPNSNPAVRPLTNVVTYTEITDHEYGDDIAIGFEIYRAYEQEVIGNIYENPELLK